jgi:hypothetical protein
MKELEESQTGIGAGRGAVAYLERGDVGGEAVDAEHHLPRPAAAGPPGAAGDLAVVLADPPPRVHREADVGAALAARAQGPEQVAAEEPATAARDRRGGPLSLGRRAPAFRRAAVRGVAFLRRGRGFPPPRPPRSPPRHGSPLSLLSSPLRAAGACDSADVFLERERGRFCGA